jgi:hypothetical protein
MDPLSAAIITILGKYAIDAGVTLVKEAGPAAKETAARLFGKVLHYLRQKPGSQAIADGYEKNPAGYEAPMQDQVETALAADANFKEELQALVTQFEEQQQAFQPDVSVKVGQGSAAAVGDQSTAVAERGVSVTGDVTGGIVTGDQMGSRKKKK